MATIKPIEGRSVHQIQSGQVIVDLCSVAKELVENSIDAGATSIEVRFKNNGLDSIEVQDNGAGISPDDFETIALKHYTSKLSTYDDLNSLSTFGFRGEALSSLCALSKFHILTARAVDGPKGTKLDFEQSGKLKGTSVIAAKQGTTVVVEQLFYNLPVRRKELEKTVKREYNKVLSLLNAYACISTGVKFSVSNQIPKGKKTVAFSTQSNPNTKENIANVYGARTLLALIPLNLSFEMDPSSRPAATQSARDWSTQDDGSKEVKIVGHISRPVVGEGRQTPDRQMFFVNSRPCLLPQVAKAFNEVYKSYNISQSPFIFADIKLDTNAYDVNVSPDKRTILLHDQTTLLENLKTALLELFEAHDQSVPQARLADRRLPAVRQHSIRPQMSTSSDPEGQEGDTVGSVVQNEPQRQSSTASRHSPISDGSHLPGFVKASLIESFASRDTQDRIATRPARRRMSTHEDDEQSLFVPERASTEVAEADQLQEAEQAEESSRQPNQLSKAGQDFNARLASHHAEQLAAETSSISPEPRETNDGDEDEESIPAVRQTPKTRMSQSTIQNAFDRMRPLRTPAQQATITVGGTTTISTVGGSSRASRQARIHTPRFSLSGKPLSQTPKQCFFTKSLRGFAAPGTQIEESEEDEEQEEEQDEDADAEMPDTPVESSPLQRRRRASDEGTGTGSDSDLPTDPSSGPSVPAPPIAGEEQEEEEVQEEDIEGGLRNAGQKEKVGSDDEYVDDLEKKAREEAKIAKMIAEAEEAAARPSEENKKRANKLFQASKKKFTTLNLVKFVQASPEIIRRFSQILEASLQGAVVATQSNNAPTSTQLDTSNPEERLSLTVMKSDFNSMRVIGQFNLGFILAVRPPSSASSSADLFIIDQHASDEKYNFENFSTNTVLESQRLVHPHPLELTAVEEEVILNNAHALSANGFVVSIDSSGDVSVGQRARLTSLPMSKEVTFTPTDLEELLALLLDNPPSMTSTRYVPRPSKARKLLASRACRASIMIGKTLDKKKMEKVVRHMGEMDKPWSCPHGRPTMRHLYGLDNWKGWREGDGVIGLEDDAGRSEAMDGKTDWRAYLSKTRTARGR